MRFLTPLLSAGALFCGLLTTAYGSAFIQHAGMHIKPGMSEALKAHILEHEAAHANMDLSYLDDLKPLMKNCKAPDPDKRYDWPTDTIESIGHSISSYQNYTGSGRFHHGVDFRAPANVDILSPFRGQVAMIRNYMAGELYWEVAVLDPSGCLWQYHHIAKPSIPQNIQDAFEAFKKDNTKGFIEKGTKVGEIVPWPVETYGELFHHIHLNILDENKAYLNAYNFMKALPDTQAPEIKRVGIVQDKRLLEGNEVSGEYSIYVEASDLIMHEKFILPPYSLSYYFKGKPEQVLPVWTFDTLPGKDDYSARVHEYFVYGGRQGKLTCGNYQCRRFIIDVGFSKKLPQEAGDYEIVVVAKDHVGNKTEKSFAWKVK